MGAEREYKQRNQCRAPQFAQTDERERDPKSYPVPSSASTPTPGSMGSSRAPHCPPQLTKLAGERSVSNSFSTDHSGKNYAVALPHPCQDPQSQTPRRRKAANAFQGPDRAGRHSLATYSHQLTHGTVYKLLLPPRDSASVTFSRPHT